MPPRRFSTYLATCFWLMLPPLAISALLGGLLPPVYQPDLFWADIPALLAWPETVSRLLVTGLPLLMPLEWSSPRYRNGMVLYGLGVFAYGLAWWPLIVAPDSAWSMSAVGFAAPAYTPLLWIAGIGLIGFRTESARERWICWSYIVCAIVFLVSHNMHAVLIHGRHVGV